MKLVSLANRPAYFAKEAARKAKLANDKVAAEKANIGNDYTRNEAALLADERYSNFSEAHAEILARPYIKRMLAAGASKPVKR